MKRIAFARRLLGAASIFALLAVLTPARADDLFPPEWRGQPYSDYQRWEFDNDGVLPEEWNNPYGTPHISNLDNSEWLESYYDRRGVWCIPPDSVMVFHIPDAQDDHMDKLARIQLVFRTSENVDFSWTGGPITTHFGALENGWWYTFADYKLRCEPYDIFFWGGKLYLDEVVVDSICAPVPEPFTVAGLSLGLVALVRRRRSA